MHGNCTKDSDCRTSRAICKLPGGEDDGKKMGMCGCRDGYRYNKMVCSGKLLCISNFNQKALVFQSSLIKTRFDNHLIWQLWPNVGRISYIRSVWSEHIDIDSQISFLSPISKAMVLYLRYWFQSAPYQLIGLYVFEFVYSRALWWYLVVRLIAYWLLNLRHLI